MFIGYQPGRGLLTSEGDLDRKCEDRWPDRCQYATERWRLAKNMRQMFEVPLLKQCVALNAIFVRSPNIETYRTISPKLRQEIKEFCLPRVIKIVDALRPGILVVLGLETLALFGKSTPVLLSQQKHGRVLVRASKINGRTAIGTLHLSGAQIANSDRLAISRHINGILAMPRLIVPAMP
jgi:hypothetical protein